MSAKSLLIDRAKDLGLSLTHHNPGDITRIKIFIGEKDYFDSHPDFSAHGRGAWAQALAFIDGYEAAMDHVALTTDRN